MTTRRGGRPPQVRPRPPSSGRPAPTKIRPTVPSPRRLTSHRKVERGRGIALPFKALMAIAVAALGVGVLLLANGGLGRVIAGVGSAVNGVVDNLTTGPSPSAAPDVAVAAPILEGPLEPYTNQPTVDLVGRVPEAIVGETKAHVRIYLAIGDQPAAPISDVPVGTSQRFLVPGVELTRGANTFTATVIGPTGLESEHSPDIVYVLDQVKPNIVIASPKAGAVINAKSVEIVGKTQGRSALSLRNVLTNATVAGSADADGAFRIGIALVAGVNDLDLGSVDPAGNENHVKLSVRRGTGVLAASLSASISQIKQSKLPRQVTLTVIVTDPDGKPLAGAGVTFTLAVPGVPAIASGSLTTSKNGAATFTTTIPKGASTGQCTATAIVSTAAFGQINDRTVIAIVK